MKVKILAGSYNESTGDKIISIKMEEFPKFCVGQMARHRVLSMSWESSRARKTEKLIEEMEKEYYIPKWTIEEKGMSGERVKDVDVKVRLSQQWMRAKESALNSAKWMLIDKPHKQDVNRILEPYMLVSGIVTANEKNWRKVIELRKSEAQPIMMEWAKKVEMEIDNVRCKKLKAGEWHKPYEGMSMAGNTAKCATVSYANHNKEYGEERYKKIHDKLAMEEHWSPFEHCAVAIEMGKEVVKGSGVMPFDINAVKESMKWWGEDQQKKWRMLCTTNYKGFMQYRSIMIDARGVAEL
jgi:thymidylate synthase ThyX